MNLKSLLKRRNLLFAFLRAHWPKALLAFSLDFLANLCLVAGSLLLAQALATLFGFRSIRGALLGVQAFGANDLLLGFAGLISFKLVLDIARLRLRGRLGEDLAHWLRLLAFEQHLRADLRYHDKRDAGRSLLRFSGDLGSAQRLLAQGVLQCAADGGLLMLGLGLIAALDARLALATLGFVLAASGLGQVLSARLQKVEARRRGKKSGLLAMVSTTLLHLAGIQALNRSTRAQQAFVRKAEQVRGWGYRYHQLAATQAALPAFFAQMLLLSTLFFGQSLALPGTALFAVILVLMSWRSALARLLRVGLIWKKGFLSLEKFEALAHAPQAAEGSEELEKKEAHTLRLQHLHFAFGSKKVLQNLDFQVKKGETLQIEMPTGGGKTTLVRLLAGLYAPLAGSIQWGGQDATQLSRHSLRRLVAFASDAFPLSGHTLLDALSPSGRAESLDDTARAFQGFQARFPQVLQGVDVQQRITGRMPALSAGQQRLLQCLRAVLTRKPFLILDDPFAGLDADTARGLRLFLQENAAGKAVLLLTTPH
jgi:ABC-type multidrug transport system fused ATPase/permease subunit